jgi:hypothetical protein
MAFNIRLQIPGNASVTMDCLLGSTAAIAHYDAFHMLSHGHEIAPGNGAVNIKIVYS